MALNTFRRRWISGAASIGEQKNAPFAVEKKRRRWRGRARRGAGKQRRARDEDNRKGRGRRKQRGKDLIAHAERRWRPAAASRVGGGKGVRKCTFHQWEQSALAPFGSTATMIHEDVALMLRPCLCAASSSASCVTVCPQEGGGGSAGREAVSSPPSPRRHPPPPAVSLWGAARPSPAL